MEEIVDSKQKFVCVFVLFAMSSVTMVEGKGTVVGFYSSTCRRAESIVKSIVQSHFRSDPTVAPALLRMHFHDCFVHGCDASILIEGPKAEKTAPPNLSVRGYEVIDDAKARLEAECPGVVSCADIIALAARDAVVLANGSNWEVPIGRRDGRVSLASDTSTLVGFTESVDSQKGKFAAFGLNTKDLVTLVGGHTIGKTSCRFFSYRLYNFTTIGNGADQSMNPAFVSRLRSLCPQDGDGLRQVALDNGSANKFDASFFKKLRNRRGILESDQKLWTDSSTKTIVQRYLGVSGLPPLDFNVEFGKSMVKMSNIGVKTGSDGEIRRKCSVIN